MLAVNDEQLILIGIAKALCDSAQVRTVGSAEKALVEITARHYDLCFLDIHLPGLTGLKAMEKIRELSPGTRVAIMFGSHLDETMKKRIAANACTFIEKLFKVACIWEIFKGAGRGKDERITLGRLDCRGIFTRQGRAAADP